MHSDGRFWVVALHIVAEHDRGRPCACVNTAGVAPWSSAFARRRVGRPAATALERHDDRSAGGSCRDSETSGCCVTSLDSDGNCVGAGDHLVYGSCSLTAKILSIARSVKLEQLHTDH